VFEIFYRRVNRGICRPRIADSKAIMRPFDRAASGIPDSGARVIDVRATAAFSVIRKKRDTRGSHDS